MKRGWKIGESMPEAQRIRKEFDPRISTADSKGIPYNVRYKRVREATGKSPQDIAALVGMPIHANYDLEECEGELNRQASIGDLSKLASVLGIPTRLIFDDEDEKQPSILPNELCARIKEHLHANRMSVTEFEDRVGFVIEPSLRDPSMVLNWNVDCLRFVCAELGVDWRLALS